MDLAILFWEQLYRTSRRVLSVREGRTRRIGYDMVLGGSGSAAKIGVVSCWTRIRETGTELVQPSYW